jgi:hypothetical protein
MSKARARERAKAKAAQKIKKRQDTADQPDQNIHAGKFDPKAHGGGRPGVSVNSNNAGAVRRGAARSR